VVDRITRPQIAANDFARQWQDISADALEAVDRVGRSGWLILGEEVAAFERELAAWWGVPHAVGVASGLDALEIGLRCAGVGSGAKILTTPLTAFATTLAILRAGAEPVWCDVDESGGLDLKQARAAIEADSAIQAVLPVHLYGHPLDPIALQDLTTEHGVAVIEDCAQSAGAFREGAATGTVGIAAATSLYPTKNLGAMGDGGVVLTGDAEVAAQARMLRDYGQKARYEHAEAGLNSRLDELHAAILRSAMLPRLDRFLRRRAEVAGRYEDALCGSSLRPIAASGGSSGHHLYPVEVVGADPAAVAASLKQEGIAVGRHYPFLCPEQAASGGRGEVFGDLEVASRLTKRELSLPIHPYLDDDEVEAVVEACRKVAG
jgi:dTDP-4-amino-4,6-dideoxygalactose transaminase